MESGHTVLTEPLRMSVALLPCKRLNSRVRNRFFSDLISGHMDI